MQINVQILPQHLQKKRMLLYLLIGQDHYLLEKARQDINSSFKETEHCEKKQFVVHHAEDWQGILDEANNYSLFSETVLLNVYYDKKTLDATGKKILSHYLATQNPRACILLIASNLPAKQIQWLKEHAQALIVTAYPFNAETMKNWLASQLKASAFTFEKEIPELIHQYTQGNMLASAQVIEKLFLSHEAQTHLNCNQVLEHLFNQSERSLFELVEACLQGQAGKAIQIIRQASANPSEATLVLWILTQELRTLLQLSHLKEQKVEFKAACSQLKIWPQRVGLYQAANKRMRTDLLTKLLRSCATIDEQIKSSLNTQAWNAIEALALQLCCAS